MSEHIHVIMTRDDGNEEGNQWEFSGTDDQLYDLFATLCRTIVSWPIGVVPPKSKEQHE